jgi:pilus assembly protein CpaF
MESEIIILQDIFVYRQKGLDSKGKVIGHYEFTGVRPKFIEKLQDHGIQVPFSIFQNDNE